MTFTDRAPLGCIEGQTRPARRAGERECALSAAIGNGSRSPRRGLRAAVLAEVPGEEPQRGVQLECRDFPVLAWVGVQRLLG